MFYKRSDKPSNIKKKLSLNEIAAVLFSPTAGKHHREDAVRELRELTLSTEIGVSQKATQLFAQAVLQSSSSIAEAEDVLIACLATMDPTQLHACVKSLLAITLANSKNDSQQQQKRMHQPPTQHLFNQSKATIKYHPLIRACQKHANVWPILLEHIATMLAYSSHHYSDHQIQQTLFPLFLYYMLQVSPIDEKPKELIHFLSTVMREEVGVANSEQMERLTGQIKYLLASTLMPVTYAACASFPDSRHSSIIRAIQTCSPNRTTPSMDMVCLHATLVEIMERDNMHVSISHLLPLVFQNSGAFPHLTFLVAAYLLLGRISNPKTTLSCVELDTLSLCLDYLATHLEDEQERTSLPGLFLLLLVYPLVKTTTQHKKDTTIFEVSFMALQTRRTISHRAHDLLGLVEKELARRRDGLWEFASDASLQKVI
jgi:hypothetical protein